MTLYGYRPDPKTPDLLAKDKDFTTQLKPYLIASTTGDIDLSRYSTPTNQYSLSACAGNSTADSVEIVSAIEEEDKAKKENRAPIPVPQLSRLFVYSMARSIMDDDGSGHGQIDRDQGTFIRLCFDILSRFGICEEDIWPYDTTKVFVPPSVKAMRQAVGHRIHSYYRIKQTGKDRIPEIIAALRGRHPVVFGTQISKQFGNIKSPYISGIPNDPEGGHAQIIVGWVNGLFKVKNSWGQEWADSGFSYFTPEYVAWDQTQDIWVPTTGTVFSR
jgi:Papain family cysteine protease